MDEMMAVLMTVLEGAAAEDWAVAAAVLFATLILIRSLRMMRRAARATAKPRRRDLQAAAAYTAQSVDQNHDTANDARMVPEQRADAALSDANSGAATGQSVRFQDSVVNGPVLDSKAARRSPVVARQAPPADLDADEVAQALTSVRFAGTSLMKWQEYCLLRDIEGLMSRLGSGHRLFCHVALEEFFSPEPGKHSDALCGAVKKAIAPFRVDFLIVDRQGYPALGLGFDEIDPVVRTVFRQADVPCLAVGADYDWTQLETVLTRHLGARPQAMPISA